jgi:hypothetical protein
VTTRHGELLRLGGFALAHAAWSIEDGETLCTLAMVNAGEERELVRFEAPSIPESLNGAQEYIHAQAPPDALVAVVFDGYVTGDDGVRRDALVVQLVAGREPLGRIVQPYEPGQRARIPLLGKSRSIRLVDATAVEGPFGDDAPGHVLEGAREHQMAARLFEGLRPD